MKSRNIICALMGVLAMSSFAAGKVPSFTMRIDDNKAPADWKRVADIFESRGMRISFAINPGLLSESQGNCLRELSERGHVIMDHTPNHHFYVATYHDIAAFERAKGKSFVNDFDENAKRIYFKYEADDANAKNFRTKAKIEKNVITFADEKLNSRRFFPFIKLPGRAEVFGVRKNAKLNTNELQDFWGRALKETVDMQESEVLVYGNDALQPCDDVLRELAMISRERFDHFKLPRPTIWVRPGGWCPGIKWQSLERIYGREFGYVNADSEVGAPRGATRWTTGYDAMYFFDQGADITPEQLVDGIEKRIKEGKYHVTLSHMWNHLLPGRQKEYFEKTERFAQLIIDRKIPSITMLETIKARFGEE